MAKTKVKRKRVTGIRLIIKWLRSTLYQALTIGVWVITWSIVEPYIRHTNLSIKLLTVLVFLIVLQGDIRRR